MYGGYGMQVYQEADGNGLSDRQDITRRRLLDCFEMTEQWSQETCGNSSARGERALQHLGGKKGGNHK